MFARAWWLVAAILVCPSLSLAEPPLPYQVDFPPEEFQTRWKTVFDRIGDHAVAIIWNMHYYRNTAQLKSGDLVLMDFAPEYHYYTSDIARMWPVSGKFHTEQREILQFVLDYRNAILKRIRPGVTPRAIQAEAKTAMEEVFSRTKFSKPIYETAARRLVNSGGGVFSHPVGMAVHDDGGYARGVLKPGQVFSIDPQLRVPEERLYYRYEDVIAITENGYENFTDFLPVELDDIERLVGAGGLLQQFPPHMEPKGARDQ